MEPTVTTKQGQVRGRIDRDHKHVDFFSFCGIPYAKPPIGDLRFRAPQPPEPWTGIRDATKEGDESYSRHMVFRSLIGSEDCLVLNVFTRNLPKPEKSLKPVMLWIHGGGFVTGSSKTEMYGPEFLLQGDVVVVSINYRLGVLGFLSLEDSSLGVPGNAGLKDMVMALKWVQDNIEAFNGDPGNVTIFGESAGGAAVHLLVLSPMAKGLFHKAIAQSGCAFNLWVPGRQCGEEMAGYLGYTGSDQKKILETLQAASKEELMMAQEKCKDPFNAFEVRPHGPVVEKACGGEDAFLPDEPMNLILSGNYNKVPMILGYTDREGILFDIIEKRSNLLCRITDFENAVPHLLKLPRGSTMSRHVADKINQFYFSGQGINEENLDEYYQLQTDNFFLRGIYSTLKNHLATAHSPIYFYRFSVDSTLNIYKILGEVKHKGACHADDIGYLFKNTLTPEIQPGTLEDLTIRRCVTFWTNFARTGNPNPETPSHVFPVVWPPAKPDALDFIDIGDSLVLHRNPEPERMKFWDEIYSLNPATSKL